MATGALVDETYEFHAPRFFDFLNKETDAQIHEAEIWFETSLSYAPSPFMPKIKVRRSDKIDGPCDFGDEEKIQKVPGIAEAVEGRVEQESSINVQEQQMVVNMEVTDWKDSFGFASDANPCKSSTVCHEVKSSSAQCCLINDPSFTFPVLSLGAAPAPDDKDLNNRAVKTSMNYEAYTPKVQMISNREKEIQMAKSNQTDKKVTSLIKQSSSIKPKNHTPAPVTKGILPQKSAPKCPGSIHTKYAISTDMSQENQAIKRRKLDGDRSKKIHNVKPPVLFHKSKPGLLGENDLFLSGVKSYQEQRKEVEPYISMAEMVEKFQSRTREIGFQHSRTFSQVQKRPKLTLTRPKEPEFETAHRFRAVRVKSSADLEQEALAKMPKFKARPLNKKIFEAPSLPALPRSTPQLPDFNEFHLRTLKRANQHAETASVTSSIEAASVNQCKRLKLTEPRPPVLETSVRARPTMIKSSQDLELEELEKIPKFKARPLNKKIFESKGDLGLFSQSKSQITTPQEFHFATNDRLGPPPSTVVDLFDKLSLQSESSNHSQHDYPRLTKPNPFHLHTEERGQWKEKLFTLQVIQNKLEEEKARIPKANPFPYSTDHPLMPPKPVPKASTIPELFHLDGLIRHEEEMQKMMQERERFEKEEAQRRIFRARPIILEDPIPLPERQRKPLTDVQEFVLQVDHRAAQRFEYEKKIKEKEAIFKKIKEEQENVKMIEEENEIKEMRRAMVPHARPVPNFDHPFHAQRSTKENTIPKSPKLLVRRRGRRQPALHLR